MDNDGNEHTLIDDIDRNGYVIRDEEVMNMQSGLIIYSSLYV